MLVALAAKNAILIFEFAVLNRQSGHSVYDSAMIAARERLRPIVMTSIAFILGCVPLAIAVGASANSRHSIGTGVIGGMLAATVIAIFFIPMFYYVIEGLSEKMARAKADKANKPEAGMVVSPSAPSGGGASDTPLARREDERDAERDAKYDAELDADCATSLDRGVARRLRGRSGLQEAGGRCAAGIPF
jgi:multidrug efflux pump